MEFPHGVTLHRHRRKRIQDPHNPFRTVPGPWDDPDSIALPGAFVATSSSIAVPSATRSELLTLKSLFLTDLSLDVQVGDRVGGATVVDAPYAVDAKPEADMNPFTGWQPVQEIPLKEVTG